jgi:ferritin-like metal-binding protein YciE
VIQLESPRELFVQELRSALAMERSSLELLQKFEQRASYPHLRQQLAEHARETEPQIQNLHAAFDALGEVANGRASPVLDSLEEVSEQMIARASKELVDLPIVGSWVQLEHHEIAVYNGLIIAAETTGDEDLVPLFQENLEREEQALDAAVRTAEQVSHQLALRRS